MGADRRARGEEVGFAGPPRGQQRVAAAGEGAGLGPGRPLPARRRPPARRAPGRGSAPPASSSRACRPSPPPGPQRVELGRGAVLASLAEGAALRPLRLARRRRAELVRALGPARGEDRPQPAQLVDADLGRAQDREGGGRRASGGGSGGGSAGPAAAAWPCCRRLVVGAADERLEHVHRQREDDRRVLVAADFQQRLQVAQLQRGRVGADDVGRVGELLRRLELALGVDDLGPPLALGLGLAGDRPLHLFGDLDVLDLDRGHLHAPGLGRLVDDLLQLLVEPLALGEQLVELGLAEHRAQRRLGDLRGGEEEVFDLDDRLARVDDAEVGDRVDAGGDVVAGDHLLRRDVERDRPQVDLDHPVDERDQQDQARALLGDQAAEAEDDAALVLAQDPHRGADRDQGEERQDDDDSAQRLPSARSFLGSAGRRLGPDHQRQPVDRLDPDSIPKPRPGRRRRPAARARASPAIEDLALGVERRADLGDRADHLLGAGADRLVAVGGEHFAGDEVEVTRRGRRA